MLENPKRRNQGKEDAMEEMGEGVPEHSQASRRGEQTTLAYRLGNRKAVPETRQAEGPT